MKYVSISGPVAAGKTTLLGKLLEALGDRATAHEECPSKNPFINAYYSDSRRWSFQSQIAFLSLYFDDAGWKKPDHDFYFYDRCLVENLVIARYRLNEGDLTQDEYDTIEKIANGISDLMPPIDKYIYIQCSVPKLLEHLRTRDRSYERALDTSYAEKQKALYDAWLETLPKNKVLVVDADKEIDLKAILSFLGS